MSSVSAYFHSFSATAHCSETLWPFAGAVHQGTRAKAARNSCPSPGETGDFVGGTYDHAACEWCVWLVGHVTLLLVMGVCVGGTCHHTACDWCVLVGYVTIRFVIGLCGVYANTVDALTCAFYFERVGSLCQV